MFVNKYAKFREYLLHSYFWRNFCFTKLIKNMAATSNNRELKEPRRRRQQERHKFTYLTMKNNTFSRFARAFFIFGH